MSFGAISSKTPCKMLCHYGVVHTYFVIRLYNVPYYSRFYLVLLFYVLLYYNLMSIDPFVLLNSERFVSITTKDLTVFVIIIIFIVY